MAKESEQGHSACQSHLVHGPCGYATALSLCKAHADQWKLRERELDRAKLGKQEVSQKVRKGSREIMGD